MRCPRCSFEGEAVEGGCARCGYGRKSKAMEVASRGKEVQNKDNQRAVSRPVAVAVSTLGRGMALRQGRYRVVEQISLPRNQQDQGTAWLATDAQASNRYVLIREVVPQTETENKEQVVRGIAQRFAELGKHPGFPGVVDMFGERNSYYIVYQYIEGRSLANFLKDRGGFLPEALVVDYGIQLCDILLRLEEQQPVLIHGAINPDTIIISPDGKQIYLILTPPFLPTATDGVKATAWYHAPEQIEGKVSSASDIYGLGATLYSEVTGFDPREHMAFFYPPARSVNPLISTRLEKILKRALTNNVRRRYENPAILREELQTLSRLSTADAGPVLLGPGQQQRQIQKRLSQRRARSAIMMTGITLLSLIFLISGISLAVAQSPVTRLTPVDTAAATAQRQANDEIRKKNLQKLQGLLLNEATIYKNLGYGLSNGNIIFDLASPSKPVKNKNLKTCTNTLDCKKVAADFVKEQDYETAISYLDGVLAVDPSDPEALIYRENLRILSSRQPTVTVIYGVNYNATGNDLKVQKDQLRGAYLAQFMINQSGNLPNGLQMSVELANVGSTDINAAGQLFSIIQQRVTVTNNVENIVGIVGWPTPEQAYQVRNNAQNLNLPMISATSSNLLSDTSAALLNIIPSYQAQGQTLGRIATDRLKGRKILLFIDKNSQPSLNLGSAVQSSLRGKVDSLVVVNFTTGVTDQAAFGQLIQQNIGSQPDLIISAGTDIDAERLTHGLNDYAAVRPTDQVLANLNVLSGSIDGTSHILGASGSKAITEQPTDLKRLSFITFADPIVWKSTGGLTDKENYFVSIWKGNFQNSKSDGDNLPDPNSNSLLAFDSIVTISQAIDMHPDKVTPDLVKQALVPIAKEDQRLIYQGLSGKITFTNQGSAKDKAMFWLTIDDGNVVRYKEVFGTFQ